MPGRGSRSYVRVMETIRLSALLAEPAPARPSAPNRVDVLLGLAATLSVAGEITLVRALRWDPLIGLMLAVLALGLPWRRARPLAAVVSVFGMTSLLSIASLLGATPAEPASMLWVLLLPYALARWGSGREAASGLLVLLATATLALITSSPGPGEAVAGVAVLLLPAAMGVAVRSRSQVHQHELEEARLRERQQLARDLHDTVAHHVSAIVVQAQAGQAVAASHPARAVEALGAIEGAATRALHEMRTAVRVLRSDGEEPAIPTGVRDLPALAEGVHDLHVTLHIDDRAVGLPVALDTAIHRLVQEGLTNAVRHARRASHVEVRVTTSAEQVEVTVLDDGRSDDAGRGSEPNAGFGLIGMRERAALLGGTLTAGPTPQGGWQVRAVLPRTGSNE